MAIELTKRSIEKLCNGILVQQPILQLLGYEVVELKSSKSNYRLVLSDGIHMNSYFFLSIQLNDLIIKKQVKYGTILKIDEYKFMDGENCTNHSRRCITFIERVTVLIHRNVFGNPQPLTNVEKKKKPLINLNKHSRRMFNSIEQLENNLISIKDLNKQSNGNCKLVLKLTVKRKYPIDTYSRCRILNINMEDSTGSIRVSTFNFLSDQINDIFEENRTYYITDFSLKNNNFGCEIKLKSYSVIINCDESMQSTKTSNFNSLLNNNPNTFCDLIGVCIEIGDVEVCGNSNSQTEVAKRDIVLIDTSVATITLKVWGENVNKFDENFDDPPIVMVKQAVLKQFNGVKHFSMIKCSVLSINPNTVEAHELKKWYNALITMEEL